MTIEKYEQMELDTRKDVEVMATSVTNDAIDTIGELAMQCGEKPTFVRNRHEAYGIAAEHLGKITAAVKSIKNDVATLLGTLSDQNYPAVEATSSICNSCAAASAVLLRATADMKRTLNNLYTSEMAEPDTSLFDNPYDHGTLDFEETDDNEMED